MPDKLPEDDACYIVSKHIYLKKKSGLIDAMIKVSHINMGEELPEFARMKLPKIKAKVFGKIVGFFKLAFGEYHSESGVILNLKTHPTNPKLKKIDYTIPHQTVSNSRCKYNIVVDPSYINCGTIHCHSDFGAFHSTTDEKDERYFDGLHITVGHINLDEVSIAACIVINDKRVPVDPCDYIEGIENATETRFLQTTTKFYKILDHGTIVSDEENLKFVTPANYMRGTPPTAPSTHTKEWDEWFKTNRLLDKVDDSEIPKTVCEECIFKEVKVSSLLDDIVFDDDVYNTADNPLSVDGMLNNDVTNDLCGPDDITPDDNFDMSFTEQDKIFFERDSTPLFHSGEIDEDGIKRHDNSIPIHEFESVKNAKLKKSIKCDDCGSTFFIENPEMVNACPSCEKKHDGNTYTAADFLREKRAKEGVLTNHEE